MQANQYWKDDPWLVEAYREAEKLRNQRRSNDAWLQGLYNFNALSVVIGNALRKKGEKPEQYMAEPIRLLPLTEEEKAAKAEEERQKTIAYFNRMAKQWEKKVP